MSEKVLSPVKDLIGKKTNKITLDERMEIFLNEDFQNELAKRLKYYRASSATRISLTLCFIVSIAIGLLGFKFNFLLWIFWIPAIVGLFFFKNPYKSDRKVVWEFLSDYLKEFGFDFNLHDEYYGKLIGIRADEFRDLINKESVESVFIDTNGLFFKTDRTNGMIRRCSATEIHHTEKGSSKNKVFDGILVELDRLWDYEEAGNATTEEYINLQIQPISKLGRLIQNTVSSFSSSMSDIRFYNEELNDVMVMKSENFIWDKSKVNEKMGGLHTAAFENVLYEIWKNYGVFYLKFHKGKIFLAFNQQGGLFKKTFDSSRFPKYSMIDDSFDPAKWGELFYFVGVIEALTYFLRKFNLKDREDENEYAKDYSDLIQKIDYSTSDRCKNTFTKFKKTSAFPSITTLENIKNTIENINKTKGDKE